MAKKIHNNDGSFVNLETGEIENNSNSRSNTNTISRHNSDTHTAETPHRQPQQPIYTPPRISTYEPPRRSVNEWIRDNLRLVIWLLFCIVISGGIIGLTIYKSSNNKQEIQLIQKKGEQEIQRIQEEGERRRQQIQQETEQIKRERQAEIERIQRETEQLQLLNPTNTIIVYSISDYLPIDVWINGNYKGKIDDYYFPKEDPDCENQDGVVFTTVNVGQHRIKVRGKDGNTTEFNISVKENECVLVPLDIKPTNGKIMVYSKTDNLPVDIWIDGIYKGKLDSYFNGQPICGQNGTITATASVGQHKIDGKYKDGTTFTTEMFVKAGDCTPVELAFIPTNGKIMVYSKTDNLPVDIWIDGIYKGKLDSYFNGQPICGQNGTITATVSVGQHKIEGKYKDGATFTIERSVKAGDCTPVELDFKPTNGKIMIYSKSSYLPVDIWINGSYKGQLNSYFNGQPNCEQNGTITVAVSVGRHKIEGKYRDGTTFTTERSVKAGDCIPVEIDFKPTRR